MMAGIAIRMAYDLNLHRRSQISLPPTFDEATRTQAQREMLNRERTWLYSFTCVAARRVALTLQRRPQHRDPVGQAVRHTRGRDHPLLRRLVEAAELRRDGSRSDGDGAQPLVATALTAQVDLHRRITRMMDTLSAVFEGRGGTFPAHTGSSVCVR